MGAKLIPDTRTEIGELDFSVDSFQKQKVLRGVNAYARLVDRLLRKRKGTNPSEPDMGVDLDSYRFSDIDSLVAGTLRNVIQDQLVRYIPSVPVASIDISTMKIKNDTILYIKIVLVQDKTNLQLAYLQRKSSILSTKVTVEKQGFINQQNKTE